MKVPPTPPQASTTPGGSRSADSPKAPVIEGLGLREGQATLARVVEQRPASANGPARLQLEIGGQTVAVDSEADLKPGTLLRVIREGDALRITGNLGASGPGVLERALAQKLPAQYDLQSGLKLIAALTRTLSEMPAGAEAGRIQAALDQVMQALPQQTRLQQGGTGSSQLIREWIQASGHFTEARLGRDPGGAGVASDLKSQLLKLAAQLLKTDVRTAAADLGRLQPAASPDLVQQALQFPLTPVASAAPTRPEPVNAGTLLRILAGMINRITVNQLHSQAVSSAATADGAAPPQTWMIDLPWLAPQQEPRALQLRIERHGPDDPESAPQEERKQQAQWRLNLALDLDHLGPVYFDLALSRERLSTRIWAQQEATWQLARSQSPRLREGLGNLGLTIDELECIHGTPPRTRTQLGQRLVDEKA